MKTKLLFTMLFLTLFVEKSISQSYVPMLNNSTWNIVVANFGGSQNFVINPGIDVVINSNTYKKFVEPVYGSNVFIREDVIAKKVYRNIGGIDKLLYDFSLQVGSVITLSNGYAYTVNSISDVNVNGGTRRRFTLSSGMFLEEIWIEGVGSSDHPLIPRHEMASDPTIYLSCSAQNEINIYNRGIANGHDSPTDCSMLLSLEDIQNVKQEINFSPNPFRTELVITTISNFENATLKIYNSIGQLVKEMNNINGQNIVFKRDNLESGMYFTQLIENGKLITTNKIVIAD